MSSNDQIRRLRIRSWRRGFKELDLMLGNFADKHLESLNAKELNEYEQLLNIDDYVVYAWLSGQIEPSQSLKNIVSIISTRPTTYN